MKTIADLVAGFRDKEWEAIINKTGYRTFRLTYSELFEKVAKTAALIEKLGLEKGDRMMLWGYNCPEWAILFLAAASKGIIIVPIDYMALPDYVKRISGIVSAKLIAHSEYKILPKIKCRSVTLESLDKLIDGMPQTDMLSTNVNEGDTLEIVFTSGTTGNPKGVILTHKNVVSNITAIKKCVKTDPDQAFLSLLPLSHLLEQTPGFLGPLSSSCRIIYIRGLKPSLIFKTLSEENVTNIVAVPRLLKLFADEITRQAEARKLLPILKKTMRSRLPSTAKKKLLWPIHKKFGKQFRYFIVGGAPFSPELEQFWNELGFTVLQGYGLTECAPVLTCNTPFASKQGSVGQPLHGVELKFGEDGEIYAKGDNVTLGYYKDKAKTRQAFTEGWFRTGDIGFADKEGFVFLNGRKKDMIIGSGGENIYPKDIEHTLLQDKHVKDACVVGLPSKKGEQIHAELILKTQASLRQIIENANKKLNQAQQIMSFGKWLGHDFPRTTTLKIKKHLVLKAVSDGKKGLLAPAQRPQTRLQALIAKIEGVKAPEIMPKAKLGMDLRLTSVNKVELVSMIEQEFSLDIDEEEITGETTIAELESMIQKREQINSKKLFRAWTLWLPIRIFRMAHNTILMDNVIRLFCRRKVIGSENLKTLSEPAIFIANHVGYFDTPNILMSLPLRIRSRIAVAAWQEYFDIPKNKILKMLLFKFYFNYASVFINIFPFPKQKGFKRSIEYAGELLDKKWNILFFPEGEHSRTGKLQPFRAGIGWLAKEMKCPIVPVRHFGLERIMAGDEHQLPRLGKVLIKIGKPVKLDYTKSIPELTNELQHIVERM